MVDRRSARSPVKVGVGGALLGAIVTFLIQAEIEGVKHDNELLGAVAAVTEQTAEILRGQREIREELLVQRRWLTRLDDQQLELTKRLDRFEREQGELKQGAIKLKADMHAWMRQPVTIRNDYRPAGHERIAEIMREIVKLEKEGKSDVWTRKGVPYARADVLSVRLGWTVSAADRDNASALLEVVRMESSSD